jgi:hypothetical protein
VASTCITNMCQLSASCCSFVDVKHVQTPDIARSQSAPEQMTLHVARPGPSRLDDVNHACALPVGHPVTRAASCDACLALRSSRSPTWVPGRREVPLRVAGRRRGPAARVLHVLRRRRATGVPATGVSATGVPAARGAALVGPTLVLHLLRRRRMLHTRPTVKARRWSVNALDMLC